MRFIEMNKVILTTEMTEEEFLEKVAITKNYIANGSISYVGVVEVAEKKFESKYEMTKEFLQNNEDRLEEAEIFAIEVIKADLLKQAVNYNSNLLKEYKNVRY